MSDCSDCVRSLRVTAGADVGVELWIRSGSSPPSARTPPTRTHAQTSRTESTATLISRWRARTRSAPSRRSTVCACAATSRSVEKVGAFSDKASRAHHLLLPPSLPPSSNVSAATQGVTRLLLTSIPFFREVVVMSFRCEHCGENNTEIQSAGMIQGTSSSPPSFRAWPFTSIVAADSWPLLPLAHRARIRLHCPHPDSSRL